MKKLFLALALILLCACAKTPAPSLLEGEPERIWQAMENLSNRADSPYRLQLSMRFGEEGDTRRVTALLWGNNEQTLRLDVMAGVGAVIAKIAESGDDFLVYLPRENNAYFHEGTNRPLFKIGVPVPFDLMQLACLLNGRFAQVFGPEPGSAAMLKDGLAEFGLEGPMAGTLVTDSAGLPQSWKQKKGGWTLDLKYDEEFPTLPASLRLVNLNGKRAIILVKERETVNRRFTDEQMKMSVPTGIPLLPLEQFKASK